MATPQDGIRNALQLPSLPENARTSLTPLAGKPVTEAEIGPRVDELVKIWRDRLRDDPVLRAIFHLEGARLAEALDRIQGVPEAHAAVLLLTPPSLEQSRDDLVERGLGDVRRGQLMEAVDFLKKLQKRRPELDLNASIDLIDAVARDCAGPLGAVYGVTG